MSWLSARLKRLKLKKIQPGKIIKAVAPFIPGKVGQVIQRGVPRVEVASKAIKALIKDVQTEAKARGVPEYQVAAEKGEEALKSYETYQTTRQWIVPALLIGGVLLLFFVARRR